MLKDMNPLFVGVVGNYNDAVTDIDESIVTYTYTFYVGMKCCNFYN